MARTPAKKSESATKMNALQRLIKARMSELEMSFRDVGIKGGLPWTTVAALANKTEHRQPPRRATLEKLAKGLDLPLDMVRAAAAESAGYRVENVETTLEAAEDVRIVATVMGQLSAADRAKLRRLAMAFQAELNLEQQERDAGR